MTLLDRLLAHDVWATNLLLDICSDLDEKTLDREFDIGHKSIRATLHHVIHNMEVWSLLMSSEPVARNQDQNVGRMKLRLQTAANRLRAIANDVAQRDGWDEEWLDTLEDPPRRKSFGTSMAHIITHSMHHRAQLLYMLRLAGVTPLPEGDLFSWEECEAEGAKESQ